jgi:hypothetical protein
MTPAGTAILQAAGLVNYPTEWWQTVTSNLLAIMVIAAKLFSNRDICR